MSLCHPVLILIWNMLYMKHINSYIEINEQLIQYRFHERHDVLILIWGGYGQ